MAKQDFPPIINSGIHKLSMTELEQMAVLAFPSDVKRTTLFYQFSSWTSQLSSLGLTGTLWLDGSFLTKKPYPNDIDCVLFEPILSRQLDANQLNRLSKLLDHDEARVSFNLDFYLEPKMQASDLFHRQAYWSGVFGFQHDRTKAKGFVEIKI